MKIGRIKKDGWLYRIAYFFHKKGERPTGAVSVFAVWALAALTVAKVIGVCIAFAILATIVGGWLGSAGNMIFSLCGLDWLADKWGQPPFMLE